MRLLVRLFLALLALSEVACDDDLDDLEGVDIYATLEVGSDASAAEIKRSYLSLARRWHPDKNAQPEATSRFAQISRAFEVLSNEEKRRKWDRLRRKAARGGASAAGQPSPKFDFAEKRKFPPRASLFERGAFGGASGLRVEEWFVPSVAADGTRRKTRVRSMPDMPLPDGTAMAEAQDFEFRGDAWQSVGDSYPWRPGQGGAQSEAAPHRLLPATPLFSREQLVSPDGSHDATIEVDGQLRVRESGSRRVVWESGSRPNGAAGGESFLLLQRDGNLLLCLGTSPSAMESILWTSNSAGDDDARYLELNERGELRILRQPRADGEYYSSCAWGSAGCASPWGTVRNQLRVTVRRLFEPSALRRPDADDSYYTATKTAASSLWSFVRSCLGLAP